MREISAGIIIYRKTKEGVKFLILYHGGRYWNFPKGKIETETDFKDGTLLKNKETAFKAALREVYEETGLSNRDLKFDSRFKTYDRFTYTRDKKKIFKIVIYYLAKTTKKTIRISEEHAGYGWFLYKDASRMLMYQTLKNNLKQAYEIIQRKRVSRGKKSAPRQGCNI